MRKFLLIALAASLVFALSNCSKNNTSSTPPSTTDLKILVTDPNGSRVAGAGVWIYTSQNDWAYGLNPAKYLATDASGQALFQNLSTIRYWFTVRSGCMNNNRTTTSTSSALVSGQTTTCGTALQTTGTLRMVNTSSNPYTIYVNGVSWGQQNGGNSIDYTSELTGNYSIRVIQVSGYAVSPTDKTYTGTLNCGGILTTTYP